MPKKVQALYDFEGQPDTGELSITCGETLTLVRTDVGEGWWEGTNDKGQSGLFPEAYVQEIPEDSDDGPPAMAPPPLPADYGSPAIVAGVGTNGSSSNVGGWSNPSAAPAAATTTTNGGDDWGNFGMPAVKKQPVAQQPPPPAAAAANPADDPWSAPPPAAPAQDYNQQAYDNDDWDSDFDDEPSGRNQMPPPAAPSGATSMLSVPTKNSTQSGSSGDLSSIGRSDSKRGGGSVAATGRTSFNRFSAFVKSGSENYVLGKVNVNVQENDVIQVVDNGDGRFSWLNTQAPYSCAIASHKKEVKLKGLKTFTAYQLTPSSNGIQVSRRYKHFDWLHERLSEKYSFIPVPPLPDKQIQGRYEEEFIEHRMNQLQSFVDRVCRHPILSQSEVWQHFLLCTDDKRWKVGKRKAEKDPLIGGSLFMAIKTPEKPIEQSQLDRQVSVFTTFTSHLDGAVRNMLKTCSEQLQKYQSHFKREYSQVGKAFLQLGAAMEQDGDSSTVNLKNAITCTGEAYEEIGKLFEEQPKNDWERLGDVMHDYRGMLAGWPSVLQVHQGAIGKRKDFERLAIEGKLNQSESLEVASRTDTLSYALLAEINTFHGQRTRDMKLVHQQFLQEQIKFYQQITERLQDALRQFDNC